MVPCSLNVKKQVLGTRTGALMLFLIPDVQTPCPQPEKIPQAHLCAVHFPACTFFVV